MINEGDLPKEVSYEEWLAINDESLFEKLDEEIPMPNIILTPGSTGYFSKSMLTARGFFTKRRYPSCEWNIILWSYWTCGNSNK
ncbi:hypothetical protein [Paraliobacillus sp. JSM ZJ581]|uniref:hypothetical protein n=1 Tax=Paraliobacillus sp. JSM ZJ581 TaxID=3342118 RepID=UPI0035A9571B